MKNEVDLGKDNIKKLLLALSVPAITGQVINALYNIVDRMYIGNMAENGDLALTGLGLCFPILMLVAAFASLIGQGGAPIAGIFMGQNDHKKAEKLMGNCFIMLILVGAVLMVLISFFKRPILFAVGASENTIGYAESYLSIYLIGTIPVQLALGLNNFINTQGFSKIGMKTVLIGAIINIILDPIFIYVFNMGVNGAALATIISQTVSALWVVQFLLSRHTRLKLRKVNFKLDFKLIKQVLSLGVSPFVMVSTESLVSIVLNSSLQRYGGDIAVGSMTIMSSIMQFIVLPLQGLGQGGQPIISYNYGAKQFKRVKEAFKCLITSGITISFIMWGVAMVFTPQLVRFFNSNEELLAFTVPAMRIYLAMIFMLGVQFSCQQTFLATGQAKVSLFLAMLRKVILLIPLAIIFGSIWGTTGVFLAEPVADFIASASTFLLFMMRRKRIFGEE